MKMKEIVDKLYTFARVNGAFKGNADIYVDT